jgi:hypothetical protein
MDKESHYHLNLYNISLIHDYTRYHAPLAGYILSWVLYPELCILDLMPGDVSSFFFWLRDPCFALIWKHSNCSSEKAKN